MNDQLKGRPFMLALLVIGCIAITTFLFWYLSGTLSITENAAVDNIGICREPDDLNYVTQVSSDGTSEIYLCGVITGTTKLYTNIIVRLDGEFFSQNNSLYIGPGDFHIPIKHDKELHVGRYEIIMSADKHTQAETYFVIGE